jgi:hypothetical protein
MNSAQVFFTVCCAFIFLMFLGKYLGLEGENNTVTTAYTKTKSATYDTTGTGWNEQQNKHEQQDEYEQQSAYEKSNEKECVPGTVQGCHYNKCQYGTKICNSSGQWSNCKIS